MFPFFFGDFVGFGVFFWPYWMGFGLLALVLLIAASSWDGAYRPLDVVGFVTEQTRLI